VRRVHRWRIYTRLQNLVEGAHIVQELSTRRLLLLDGRRGLTTFLQTSKDRVRILEGLYALLTYFLGRRSLIEWTLDTTCVFIENVAIYK